MPRVYNPQRKRHSHGIQVDQKHIKQTTEDNNEPELSGQRESENPPVVSDSAGVPYLPMVEAMIIGAAAGLCAVLLLEGIAELGRWRIALSQFYPAEIVLPLFGLIGGLLAGIMVQIAPEVAGSGIPQVRALLSRVNVNLDLKSAVFKLLGGVVTLGSGLFMGREGPTVQVGAAIASQLSRWLPTSRKNRRQLIAAGAGAGLAAAFDAPLAGVTFVLEELLKEVTPSTVSISLIACFSAAVVENLLGKARANTAITHAGVAVPVHLYDIAFYIVLGLLAAFFGSAFNTLIMGFLGAYKRVKVPTFVKTAFAGLVTGLIVAHLPDAFHNYAQARQLINAGTVPPHLVPLAFASFFLLVLLAYGSGAPGGLFAPSLVLGAALGYMVGFAHYQATGVNLLDIFTQVGMGAFFAAVARVPLTSTAIVFEMSGNFGLIPPLMIASVIASSVADLLSKGSLYDLLMVWGNIHLSGPNRNMLADSVRVATIVRQYPLVLSSRSAVKEAEDRLSQAALDGCPVVDKNRLVGVIRVSQIEVMHKDGLADDISLGKVMTRHPVFVSPYDSLEDILFLFTRLDFDWLPVADDRRFVGVVFRSDVNAALFPSATCS
jgi:CIC family chloride channel protein